MKKILVLILTALLALSSLPAAREYVILASSVDCDTETDLLPVPGFYSQYQFAFRLSEAVSLGFGTYINIGFPINGIKDTGHSSIINITTGPAFALNFTNSDSISFLLGPEIVLSASRSGEDNGTGRGVGFAFSYTFTPQSEQQERVQMGITCGLSGSLTFYEKTNFLSYSGRAFIGLTVLQPFVGIRHGDIYDAVLDTIYDRY